MPDPYLHRVEPGETIRKIAARFSVSDWRTIWESDLNADLRDRRNDPNVLYEGDTVLIPLAEDGEEPGDTEQHHPFQAPASPLVLRVRLLDKEFRPLRDRDYTVKLQSEPTPRRGRTDSQGRVIQEVSDAEESAALTVRIPGGRAPDGSLLADSPVTFTLRIGRLDPVLENAPDESCVSGVKQRLNNLGFRCGSVTETLDDRTRAAIQAFCAKVGLTSRDRPDAEFQTKLKQVHDEIDQAAVPEP